MKFDPDDAAAGADEIALFGLIPDAETGLSIVGDCSGVIPAIDPIVDSLGGVAFKIDNEAGAAIMGGTFGDACGVFWSFNTLKCSPSAGVVLSGLCFKCK